MEKIVSLAEILKEVFKGEKVMEQFADRNPEEAFRVLEMREFELGIRLYAEGKGYELEGFSFILPNTVKLVIQ